MNKMRTLFVGVAFAAVLLIGTSAQALTTFSLTVGGSGAITVAPSTSVTVDVVMTNDINIDAYGVSADSTGVGTVSGGTATAAGALFAAGSLDCTANANTRCQSWAAVNFLGPAGPGTYTIGTFVLHAAASGIVGVGEFNTGIDGQSDPNVVFNGLAVTVPEPSTAALMLVGLAGLARVGRRD